MKQATADSLHKVPGNRLAVVGIGLLVLLAACEEVPPRTFAEFMDDRIAREGTIAHCNENREESLNDIECANARRAAATIALRQERDRREQFERESELKLEALRAEIAERERRAAEIALAAAAAERQAYENLWRDEDSAITGTEAPPTDGQSFGPPEYLRSGNND